MNKAKEIRDFAIRFGQSRLKQIQVELDTIHATMPELFPAGRILVDPSLPRPLTLHRQERTPKPKAAKKAKAKRARARKPIEQPSDATGQTMLVSEAAEILKLSDAGVRYNIANGNLRVFDTNGPNGKQRLLRSEVEALAQAKGILKPDLVAEVQQQQEVVNQ